MEHGLDRLAEADLVLLLPGNSFRDEPALAVVDAVRAAHERGAIIASQCVGSFLPAATGLLDGRRATTHWRTIQFGAAAFGGWLGGAGVDELSHVRASLTAQITAAGPR